MNALACRLWELHQVTARLRVRTILEATALLTPLSGFRGFGARKYL